MHTTNTTNTTMATSNVHEIVSGEDLDIILELLESDFLEEETEVQAAFEDAIEEVRLHFGP